jgi:hypothetical protein
MTAKSTLLSLVHMHIKAIIAIEGCVMKSRRIAQTKNGFAPKVCVTCGLEFEWRKKWQKDWDQVKYCSKKCKGK